MCVEGLEDAGRLGFGEQQIDKPNDIAVCTRTPVISHLPFYEFLIDGEFVVNYATQIRRFSSLVGKLARVASVVG